MGTMSDTFSNWLANEIKQRGLSFREIARQAGVSHTLVSRILSGDMPVSADFCIKVASVLKVSPEFLLRMAEILPPLETFENATMEEINEALKNLPPDQQRQVLEYIRFISRSQ